MQNIHIQLAVESSQNPNVMRSIENMLGVIGIHFGNPEEVIEEKFKKKRWKKIKECM